MLTEAPVSIHMVFKKLNAKVCVHPDKEIRGGSVPEQKFYTSCTGKSLICIQYCIYNIAYTEMASFCSTNKSDQFLFFTIKKNMRMGLIRFACDLFNIDLYCKDTLSGKPSGFLGGVMGKQSAEKKYKRTTGQTYRTVLCIV
jgi:hypothetical protein